MTAIHTEMTDIGGVGNVAGLTVAVVTGGVPHYRWPFFTELAERGASLHLVAAGKLPAGIITGSSPDARLTLTQLRTGRTGWRSDVTAELRRIAPDVILLEHGAALDYSWTTLLSRSIKAPRVLWTHGIARQELYGGKRGPASWGRWTQLALADGIVCYDERMAARLQRRYPAKVVGCAPNSTDGESIVAERERCERDGREPVRSRLGLTAEFYLAGLGRLVPEKDFARLVRIAAALRGGGVDVGVILIGGGPGAVALQRQAEALGLRVGRDIVFAGAIADSEQLARWLFASDACVSPGFLGLSTVDCLFAGVPVLSYEPTTDGPYHSPEWQHLVPGKTGYFAPIYSDEALVETCRAYLTLPAAERTRARAECVDYAQSQLGVSRMVDGMLDVVSRVLDRAVGGSRGDS